VKGPPKTASPMRGVMCSLRIRQRTIARQRPRQTGTISRSQPTGASFELTPDMTAEVGFRLALASHAKQAAHDFDAAVFDLLVGPRSATAGAPRSHLGSGSPSRPRLRPN
jgi:hypothetical protein